MTAREGVHKWIEDTLHVAITTLSVREVEGKAEFRVSFFTFGPSEFYWGLAQQWAENNGWDAIHDSECHSVRFVEAEDIPPPTTPADEDTEGPSGEYLATKGTLLYKIIVGDCMERGPCQHFVTMILQNGIIHHMTLKEDEIRDLLQSIGYEVWDHS